MNWKNIVQQRSLMINVITFIVQKCAKVFTSKVLIIFESGVSSILDPDTIPALFTKPNQTFIILSEMELNSMV